MNLGANVRYCICLHMAREEKEKKVGIGKGKGCDSLGVLGRLGSLVVLGSSGVASAEAGANSPTSHKSLFLLVQMMKPYERL